MGNSATQPRESETTYFYIINIEGFPPITGYIIVKG
jgi:hypothetical protein